jgi:hypothetical protein
MDSALWISRVDRRRRQFESASGYWKIYYLEA